ncbi:Helicase conserved C-terminal domain-containing protein [Nitrosomonas sp. Nm51]|uniref:DEAD/DEAH box helicase n=1 Tax=Nitrosomonas sp. Nm51 TaxID=133720 RepID=UPI0008CF55B8|nr:DEAD/DEAH box helicase [Nitrosomonas sp. Nm51]SER71886.1 Helicase conserved C-terminal domain-containing protein [Nitrosomonas sp. Nm51]
MAANTRKTTRKLQRKTKAELKLSRSSAPDNFTVVEWQRGLRRQFGRTQQFDLVNQGTEKFFTDFKVVNPVSNRSYRVAIRGSRPGDNFCACPDYATNELGTCKHIEFVLAKLEKIRGFKTVFARGYQPVFSELYLRYDNGRTVHFRPGIDCPEKLLDKARKLFDEDAGWCLAVQRYGELDKFIKAAAKCAHELRAYDDALDHVAGLRDTEKRLQLLNQAFPLGAEDPQWKKLLKVPLYPYQKEGVLFAVRAGRALIGDEMGLGKTIQAIAVTEILARYFDVSKVLVVCPTSLKYQWQSENKRFAGRESLVISGNPAKRRKQYQQDDFCKITNYEKLHADLDLIEDWAPELVIVDEAQRIKNWNTIASRALKRINSPYAVVLTGTPLENKLEELISLVQFVDQYRLGPTWKLLHEHQQKDETGKVTGYVGLDKIGKTLSPVMIRRLKSDVLLQLPERSDQNILLPMTAQQQQWHQENAEVVARIVARWSRNKYLSETDQRRLTCALQNMRMSCNSTYLLDQETDHGTKADELMMLFDDLFEHPQNKVVVFSQWARMQDILIRRLKERGTGYISFHGGIASEKRPKLIRQFKEDADCKVFLSTDAGAIGLNLQFANTLVNMDLPWNPALLEQRIARIHRMGQPDKVQVVNFVAKGSIEESMLSLLSFKRSLSAGILDGGNAEISLGGSRLKRFMQDVENVTTSMRDSDPLDQAEQSSAQQGAFYESKEEGCSEAAAPANSSQASKTTATASTATDPWQAIAQIGGQFVAALASAHNPDVPVHPWIERDEQTGNSHLKIPVPPPETTRQLADTFAALAEMLRK